MANIKIRNLDSASDTQITSGIYLPSALNEEEGTQEKITVKATAAQIVSGGAVYADFSEGLMVSGVAVSTGSSAGSFEGGSFNFGSTDASNNTNTVNFNQGENVRMYIDESGGVNVSEKLIVSDGKETVLGGVTTIKGATTINETLTVSDGKETILGGNTTIKETLTVADGKQTTLGGPVTIKGDSTFEQSAIFTTLSSDPAPPDGKLYRKGNDLYFGGQKILTEGQGGKWLEGSTNGQLHIHYNEGNVGIGVNSPTEQLVVKNQSTTDNRVTIGLSSLDGTQNGGFSHIDEAGNERITLSAGGFNTDQFTMLNNGNVGIGTDSPVTALDINKEISEASPIITLSRGGVSKSRFAIANATGSILDGSVTDDLCIRTEGGNIRFGTESAIKTDMSILSNGNVGIGTTNPGSLLDLGNSSRSDVIGDHSLRVDWVWGFRTSAYDPNNALDSCDLHIEKNVSDIWDPPVLSIKRSTGNVGIGIAVPPAHGKLSIKAETDANLIFSGINGISRIQSASDDFQTNTDLGLGVNGSAIFIKGGAVGATDLGYIGIGLSAPSYNIDAKTGIANSQFVCRFTTESSNNMYHSQLKLSKYKADGTHTGSGSIMGSLIWEGKATTNVIKLCGMIKVVQRGGANTSGRVADMYFHTSNAAEYAGGAISNDPRHEKLRLKGGGGMVLPRLDSDPSSPENGEMYYNTATNKFRGYQGGSWVNLA